MKLSARLVYCLLVTSFALGNLYKFSFFSPDVRISFLDIAVFLITVSFSLHNRNEIKTIYNQYQYLLRPLCLFSLIAFTSLILSIFRFGLSAFAIGGMYLARFIFFSLLFVILKSIFTPSYLRRLLFSLGLVILVTGLGQYLLLPDVRGLSVSEWDPHYFRVVGTLLDPGFIGEILLLFLVYLITRPKFYRRLHIYLIGLSYLAFSLTYSRSSFLAAYGAVFLYSFIRKSWKFCFIGVAVLSLTLIILPRAPGGEGVKLERTSTIAARIANWKNSLTIFTSHPLIGVGFNTYRYAQKEYGFLDNSRWLKSHAGAGADSSLLFAAATTGIIGLFFYLGYLRSLWKTSPGDLALRLSLLTLIIHSLFLNSLFYPFILVWLAVLTALAV